MNEKKSRTTKEKRDMKGIQDGKKDKASALAWR